MSYTNPIESASMGASAADLADYNSTPDFWEGYAAVARACGIVTPAAVEVVVPGAEEAPSY